MSSPAIWDPSQYHRYGDLRLRPALELLPRISVENPSLVHDIGTRGGETARLMAERWPKARVVGSDSWEEMLTKAAETDLSVEWVSGSIPRPVFNRLSPDEVERFSELCRAALQVAYPQRADGTTLFPFHRLFIVARR